MAQKDDEYWRKFTMNGLEFDVLHIDVNGISCPMQYTTGVSGIQYNTIHEGRHYMVSVEFFNRFFQEVDEQLDDLIKGKTT